MPILVVGQGDLVTGAALVAPTAQIGVVLVPEILAQLGGAGVQQAEIVERAIVLVVLGGQSADRGLDAQVDVLGHQDDRDFRMLLAQFQHRRQDLVVRRDGAEGAAGIHRLDLEIQLADLSTRLQLQALRMGQGDAGLDVVGAGAHDQFVEETADLAGVAADFGGALLGVVQFLDHLHRQEHVVFFELEQRRGVVHQHVGVQHIDALASGHSGSLMEDGMCEHAPRRAHSSEPPRPPRLGMVEKREHRSITGFGAPSVRPARPGHGREP